jgi:hypothetical protein
VNDVESGLCGADRVVRRSASAIGDVIRQRSAQAVTMAAGAGHDVVVRDEVVSTR